MEKRREYTVSVPLNGGRQALAERSRLRRIAMDRQEFIDMLMDGTTSLDGTKAERLASCTRAADKRTFTGEFKMHY